MPSRLSLRASSNGNLFLPRTEQRFGDRAISIDASRALCVRGKLLSKELKEVKLTMRSSTTTFKHHLKTFLFNAAYTPPTDYGMRRRANGWSRTTNAAVTVTVQNRLKKF